MKAWENRMQEETGYVVWEEFGGLCLTQPEHYLLLAIVERAVLDYVGPADTPLHYKKSAELYFRPNKSKKPYSFNWLAEHLHGDPEWFKERVRSHLMAKLVEKEIQKEVCKTVETCNTICCESGNTEGHLHRRQSGTTCRPARRASEQRVEVPVRRSPRPHPGRPVA